MALLVACAALVAAGTLRSESAAAPPPTLPSSSPSSVPVTPLPVPVSSSPVPVESPSPLPAGTSGDGTLSYADGQGAVGVATEGVQTEQYTNCRLRGKIVLNSARWLTGVAGYGAPLSVYRAYAVNHEVGHELGQWHELCPGPGQPAPVMQQQTLGLRGCVANSWPYLNGVRYRGPTADD